MIGHQDVCVDLTVEPTASIDEQVPVQLSVQIIDEDGAPVVAAEHVVDRNVCLNEAWESGHGEHGWEGARDYRNGGLANLW